MKKLFFSLAAFAFISLSSFTTNDSVDTEMHSCTYNLLNRAGDVIGQTTILLNTGTACNSAEGRGIAVMTWNAAH